MGIPDPTLEFLRSLDDPSKFDVRRGVPIARSLKQMQKDGKELVIGDDDLPDIAETTALHEAESGTVLRVTLGHIKPGQPQAEQPTLVGFARGVRAGTFGPQSVPCILADVYLSRSFADSGEASQYPFRSMEYRIDTGRISGLALLKTDPYSQLGVVQFGADGAALVTFSGESMGDQAPPPAAPPPAASGTVQMSDDDKKKADALMAYFMTANPWMARCAAEYGESKPGNEDGDNKPVKQPEGEGDDVAKEKDEDTAKMQADLAARDQRIAALEKKNDEASVDGMLAKFEAVYECDVATERELLLKLSADDRTKYIANASKRYPKKPVGQMIGTFTGHAEGGQVKKELDKDGANAVLALMQADATLTFTAARERVLKG